MADIPDDVLNVLERRVAEARDKTRIVADAYDRANPMRTADMHRDGCNCLRCAIDALRALVAELDAALAIVRNEALDDAARMVDCACECRDAVLAAKTKVDRWNACGRDPCGALDAADIRALKGEGGK